MGGIGNHLNGLSLPPHPLTSHKSLTVWCGGAHAHYKSFENNMVRLMVELVAWCKHLERFGILQYIIYYLQKVIIRKFQPADFILL